MISQYRYTDSETKQLLQTLTVICDTREQQNGHITGYFTQKGIPYISRALSFGDYSYYLPACPELGIVRNMFFTDDIVVERKASLEELSGNLAQQRDRFENEFLRAGACDITLMVENGSYAGIMNHEYRTDFNEKAFIASLMAWQQRYKIHIAFVSAAYAGQFIYSKLYYHLREILR